MLKADKDTKLHTFYLKVSDYYKSYLEIKYGKPVLFPYNSMLNVYINRFLIENRSLQLFKGFSVCSAIFNYDPSKSSCLLDIKPLTDEEKKEYVELVMPQEIFVGNGVVKVNQFFQLQQSGERLVRKEIKRDFWIAFSQFYDDCMFRASRIGENVSAEDIMSDFMNLYNIDMSKFDNMMRYWWRIRAKIIDEIEARRTYLENKTGNSLIYTP